MASVNKPNLLHISSSAHDPFLVLKLFADDPQNPFLNYDRFDIQAIRAQIEANGYALIKGLVPQARLDQMRQFWIEAFSRAQSSQRVTWGPFLGQENHIGFTKNKFNTLFRACDFFWNEPFHEVTRDICVRQHALRNLVLRMDPTEGLRFTDKDNIIFNTASHYPGHSGWMQAHVDGQAGSKSLIHILTPLTFKGKDYQDGGLTMIDRNGTELDVDGVMEPGDSVIYDGSLKHGVEPIVPLPGQTLGRIQIFPIPGRFDKADDNLAAIRKIRWSRFLHAKWLVFQNQVRVALGLNPLLR